jgi:hypothetical protein
MQAEAFNVCPRSSMGSYDIICGRCKEAFNNVGNRRFRVTIDLYLDEYLKTSSKKEKGKLIVSILRYLRQQIGVRFLKPVKGRSDEYIELGEPEAREKVGHALRDLAVRRNHVTMSEWKLEQKKRKQKETETKQPQKAAKQEDILSLDPSGKLNDDGEEEFFHQTLSLFLTVYDDHVDHGTS